ncbi:uncharacterized protein PpBr36_05904 [Pyricularia pennisetigena]|uniref:uncharacterized protein n=1 Tax=Pyricularia pennisetigena TaxID=1578925 RepID=UPI001151300C|nr:uncharacterized protein PpBr36_05904 [Pyricularia pennisetigena]TLS23101.1 hypothetical protein PpBr36_05904 [Pyricularia pennisetigena]
MGYQNVCVFGVVINDRQGDCAALSTQRAKGVPKTGSKLTLPSYQAGLGLLPRRRRPTSDLSRGSELSVHGRIQSALVECLS